MGERTKIKFCGMRRPEDIEAANRLLPDYIGFIFVPKSRRYVSFETAKKLREALDPRIKAVGVFADESPESTAELLNSEVIDLAQLHGAEDEAYIRVLRGMTDKKIIKAFHMSTRADADAANESSADFVLLDFPGGGSGKSFDWVLAEKVTGKVFLAGGLNPSNVGSALQRIHPYCVDVSSGIETGGFKDPEKMAAFAEAVRKEEEL